MKTICGECSTNFDASSHGVIVGFGLVLIPGFGCCRRPGQLASSRYSTRYVIRDELFRVFATANSITHYLPALTGF